MSDFELQAKSRENVGKGASRRLRRLSGEIPAIIYGNKKNPQNITVLHKDLLHSLENEAFYSQVITLSVDGKTEDVILKDLHRHPAKQLVLHADFLRINKNLKLTVNIPLHFINEDSSIGVKTQGGIVSHTMAEIEVSCLPANIPEYIEVDLAEVELGQIIHLSDITLPKGVESVALSHGEDHDLPVAAIHLPKTIKEEDPEESDETEDQSDDSTEDEDS